MIKGFIYFITYVVIIASLKLILYKYYIDEFIDE